MVSNKIKSELKRFLTDKQVEDLSKQLSLYETKVRDAVKGFDVKSLAAKAQGKAQLEKFSSQVNQGLNELFNYFRTLANLEKKAAQKTRKKIRKVVKKAGTAARKKRRS